MWRAICLFIYFLFMLAGQSEVFARSPVSVDMHKNTGVFWEKQLRTGQIVTTDSSDPLQLFTLLGAAKFSPFVHVGIVEVSDAGIYIYDTTATVGKFFLEGKSPSDTMKGQVRRLNLQSFMDYSGMVNIFSPPSSVNPDKLVAFARQHWAAKTPFDAYFNLEEDSKLYCSEFVALALEHAGSAKHSPAMMRPNRSLQAMRHWMKIYGPKYIFPYHLVEPRNWVGTVSFDQSRSELLIDRLIKYELYQRFTYDQKIGNILKTSGMGVALREPVKLFHKRAHDLLSKSKVGQLDLDQLAGRVRSIADETFGVAKNVAERRLPRCQLSLRSCAAR